MSDRDRTRPVRASMRHALACAATAALSWGCGGDPPTDGGSPSSGNSVVLTRADNSKIQLASGSWQYVWCGPWEPVYVPPQSVQVWVGGPLAANPYWYLQAVAADVVVGQPLAFPNTFVWDQPKGAAIFLSDPATGNELSTNRDNASGQVTFEAASCATGAKVRFVVNAVLASEVGGASVTMAGTFEAAIGQAPPWRQ